METTIINNIPINNIKRIYKYDNNINNRIKKILYPIILEVDGVIHHPFASEKDIITIELRNPQKIKNYFSTPQFSRKGPRERIIKKLYININRDDIPILYNHIQL